MFDPRTFSREKPAVVPRSPGTQASSARRKTPDEKHPTPTGPVHSSRNILNKWHAQLAEWLNGSQEAKENTTETDSVQAAFSAVRPALTAAFAFSFFTNLLVLAGPLYMMQVYDRVLSSRNISTLVLLTLIVAFVYLASSAIENIRGRILSRSGYLFDRSLKRPVFDSIQRATIRNPGQNHAQALRDLDTVRDFFTGPSIVAACDLPWVPVYIITATALHPVYGLFAVASCVISAILAIANDRATRPLLDEAGKQTIQANANATSTFRNAEVLQAMGMVSSLRSRWETLRENAQTSQLAAADKGGFLSGAIRFNRLMAQSLILGIGAWLAINREISPGVMIAASIIVGRTTQPIELVIGNWKTIITTRASFLRLRQILSTYPPPAERMLLPTPKGALAAENIVVLAPGRQSPVLRAVSFAIPPGTTLGIVGPSAAGKSTLARAITGIWPLAAGTIRLDGNDLRHWDPDQLGSAIGYLPQAVELFDGTIAENVARFQAIDNVKIIEAAMLAGVHEMIQQLPQGYNTEIGDGGHTLSGGQRQRIGLARALYGTPALIVLDEPNANLDAHGEHALNNALAALNATARTVVIVTHKTNILTRCDAILMLAGGTVQAFGPRDEILARILGPRPVPSRHPSPGRNIA